MLTEEGKFSGQPIHLQGITCINMCLRYNVEVSHLPSLPVPSQALDEGPKASAVVGDAKVLTLLVGILQATTATISTYPGRCLSCHIPPHPMVDSPVQEPRYDRDPAGGGSTTVMSQAKSLSQHGAALWKCLIQEQSLGRRCRMVHSFPGIERLNYKPFLSKQADVRWGNPNTTSLDRNSRET